MQEGDELIVTGGAIEKGSWTERALPVIMECGVYLFALLMFAGRFGTFREIGLYLPAVLWLIQGTLRKGFDFEWREPLSIALLAFCLSAAASSLISAPPLQSFLLLKKQYLKMILLYLVISTTFAQSERLKRMTFFMACVGIVYLGIGFHKIFTEFSKLGSINYDDTRDYASTFLFFVPFFLLQTEGTERPKRVFWTIPLIGALAGIFIIGVRGSWLALLGILCVWIYFSGKQSKKIFGILKIGVPVLLLAIVTIFFLFPGQYKLIEEHTFQKAPLSLREETWNTFFLMSRDRLLTGHGIDDTSMSEHYRDAYKNLKGAYPVEGFNPTTPHNQFIKILYQQGVLGLLLYISLLSVLFFRMIKTFLLRADRDNALAGIAVIAVVLGEYVIRCLTEDRSLVPLGLLIGMAGAYLNPRKGNKEGE